ncbi:CRISPR-associated protein Cas5 [Tepidibacter formicigenes]|jgi:CRISPR-associated protein Cas5 subtype I-B|uniref:CRISPR-associated protein Cas5t n=1 Tax=Tepidibacter formicigenes DSM 15518 TaxID=1123349 RepID=A0A1M6RBA9_9FIRM|nr:CRISPR-associated protein Cas5 [Tepidibacter formicigenes]SHK29726.1 CRISPR-associated protein Cas5t [Tepidibacter formicigenes DSM 15518]
MQVIKFKVEGILNSFRIPFFRTYHKTFLAPPKTAIIGMITNILRKSEKWYYDALYNDLFDVSVVIDNIQGKTKDLWGYKNFKKGNRGRSVIRRDKLYKATYTIYLKINDENIKNEVLDALKNPKSVPALGLDDEIIKIYDVEEVYLKKNEDNIINSVFIGDEIKYRVKMDIDEDIYLPASNITPLKYSVDVKKGVRTKREIIKQGKQVEYMNCKVEIKSDIPIYEDGINKVVFY